MEETGPGTQSKGRGDGKRKASRYFNPRVGVPARSGFNQRPLCALSLEWYSFVRVSSGLFAPTTLKDELSMLQVTNYHLETYSAKHCTPSPFFYRPPCIHSVPSFYRLVINDTGVTWSATISIFFYKLISVRRARAAFYRFSLSRQTDRYWNCLAVLPACILSTLNTRFLFFPFLYTYIDPTVKRTGFQLCETCPRDTTQTSVTSWDRGWN